MPTNFEGMNADDKLNPIGAYLLAHYYQTQVSKKDLNLKITQPVYALNSPRDIPLIMHLAKEAGITQYGLIIVCGGRHRTPVVVDDNKCYILESLGTMRSIVGKNSVAQIAIAISKENPDIEIHSAAAARQVDGVSCGSDAFISLKEALRNLRGENTLFDDEDFETKLLDHQSVIDSEELKDDFFRTRSSTIREHKDQPIPVAKYIQSNTLLMKSPFKHKKVLFSPGKEETIAEYAFRHKKTSARDASGKVAKEKPKIFPEEKDEPVYLNKIKPSITNNAILRRREKHRRIFEEYKASLSPEEIESIILEHSGAKLIQEHGINLPSRFLDGIDKSSESIESLCHNFAAQEISRARPNDKKAVAPEQEISLTTIAKNVKSLTKKLKP